MHIPNNDHRFFMKALDLFAEIENSLPIEFGHLTFDMQGIIPPEEKEENLRTTYRTAMKQRATIPFSELSYARREGVLYRDIHLDPLAAFTDEGNIIHNPQWATISFKLGPEEYARRDFLDFMASPMKKDLESSEYLLRTAHIQIPLEILSRGDITKAAHIFMRREERKDQAAGLEFTIPKGKEETERAKQLFSWYESLKKIY